MPGDESLQDALIGCVKACGGSKTVAHRLWPEKPVEAAQRHLLACLSEGKPERLSPEHLLMLLRLARAHGHHEGIAFILADLGYAPTTPIEPKDEAADLIRQFSDLKEGMERITARLEHLQPQLLAPSLRRAA